MSARLADHYIAHRGQQLPPVNESLMLDYVMGGNGTFARGRRPGMEVCIPIAPALVRGLSPVLQYVQWGYPKVKAEQVGLMLSISRHRAKDAPREALFHLSFDTASHGPFAPGHVSCRDGWHVEYPEQRATADEVKTLHQGPGSSEDRAVIEVHSHHRDKAYFSPQDDEDEGGMSFRVYGVLGTIFDRPMIRVRVGLFGHFMEWPAAEFFELPEGLIDCVKEQNMKALIGENYEPKVGDKFEMGGIRYTVSRVKPGLLRAGNGIHMRSLSVADLISGNAVLTEKADEQEKQR